MHNKFRTKDELFLCALHAMTADQPGVALDRYLVGKRAGLQERAVNAICALLIRANFIKKADEENLIILTPHGMTLAVQLQEH